jgi:hypothetical protein
MPWNGSGQYSPPTPAFPAIADTTISSTYFNQIISDIAAALNNTWTLDGETTPTANFPMGGFKLTGLAAGANPGDSLRWEQLFGAAVALTGTILNNPTLTGAVNAAGATTVTVPTVVPGDSSANAASTAFVNNFAFAGRVPIWYQEFVYQQNGII